MKINAVQCYKCGDIIFSRARHDFRRCTCGEIFIDGGFDLVRVGGMEIEKIKSIQIKISATKKELYNDWSKRKDMFGIIKGGGKNEKK